MGFRRMMSKITSPIFIPLRMFLGWRDKTFGTCEMKLEIEPRGHSPLDGFAEVDEESNNISELMKKVSKDRANMIYFEEE